MIVFFLRYFYHSALAGICHFIFVLSFVISALAFVISVLYGVNPHLFSFVFIRFNPASREHFNEWLARNPNLNSEINEILKAEEASVNSVLPPKISLPVLNTPSNGQTGQGKTKKKSNKNSKAKNQPKIKIDLNHPSQVNNSNSINSEAFVENDGGNSNDNTDNSTVIYETENNANSNYISNTSTENLSYNNPDENPSSSHIFTDAEILRDFNNGSPPLIIDLTQDYINLLEENKINLNIKLTVKFIYRHLKLYTE